MDNLKIIETVVPAPVYTDRQDLIDYFYDASITAIERRTMSIVLLGQRRMGKTEIFKRAVNRLFFSKDNSNKGGKFVIPVYYQFSDSPGDNFAIEYVQNFIRWYAAFKLQKPGLLHFPKNVFGLIELLEKELPVTEGLHIALDLLKAISQQDVATPEKDAVMLPREVAFIDNITIAVFLDEFQNIRMPHYNFDIVGLFQEAVESPTCPHFVTGSAMSILKDEILGRGALYGRFRVKQIDKFTDYYGSELAERSSKYYGAEVLPEMFPVISDRCGGNPYYITALIKQAAEQKKRIDNEQTINDLLAFDICSGFIWGELADQVNRWVKRINEKNITRWILYLSAMSPENEIDTRAIQKQLKKYESIEVPIQDIEDIMIKLAKGDLIQYSGLDSFYKINDPILNEFLKIWGHVTVANRERGLVEEETYKKFHLTEKRFHEYKGYLAEVYMIQVLWNSQGKTLDGKFFQLDQPVTVPARFIYIYQRHRAKAGKNIEIDIYASAGTEIWIAESKWWANPVGKEVVQNMLDQAKLIKEREGDFIKVRSWLFAYNGVTDSAKELIKQNGVLWSNKNDLNSLLSFVNLRVLPEL